MTQENKENVLFYKESEAHSFTVGALMIVFIVFLFGVFYVSLVFYGSTLSDEIIDKELSIKPSKQLTKLRVVESEKLNQSIMWLNQDAGVVSIPIQLAMESVVKKYSN